MRPTEEGFVVPAVCSPTDLVVLCQSHRNHRQNRFQGHRLDCRKDDHIRLHRHRLIVRKVHQSYLLKILLSNVHSG